MSIVPYCVRNISQLRERVQQFNNSLDKGQQRQHWTRMMSSSKYFVYDRKTRLFGINKFVAYYEDTGMHAVYKCFDLNGYRALTNPPNDRERKTSPLDGTDAREGIEQNLGLVYTPLVQLSSADQKLIEPDFAAWYIRHFSNDSIKAQKKCQDSSFILL